MSLFSGLEEMVDSISALRSGDVPSHSSEILPPLDDGTNRVLSLQTVHISDTICDSPFIYLSGLIRWRKRGLRKSF